MTLAKTLTERVDCALGCYNGTGSTIAKGVAVKGTEEAITLPGANQTDPILGITRNAIPTGTYGSVLVRGKAICTAGTAGITGGGRVGFEASTGLIVDYTAAQSCLGMARDSATVGLFSEVELLGPGATGA